MPANTSGYGTAPWWAAIILSVIVTFIGTLLFAQATWNYNNPAPGSRPGNTSSAASQPASQPATSQPAASQPVRDQGAKDASTDDAAIHKPWDALLSKYLENERVDYPAWQNDGAGMAKLDRYLGTLATLKLDQLTRDQRLAYWINLYNAAMVDVVLDRYEPGYTVSENNWGVFKEEFIDSPEGKVSLDGIEHEIIRKRWDEPGIHAALVCGAVSCPPLIHDAYTGATVQKTLEANLKRWINNPARNQIDHDTRTLRLSSIFDWYAKDFGGKDNLANFVNNYTDRDVSGYSVAFLDYDWSLNSQK